MKRCSPFIFIVVFSLIVGDVALAAPPITAAAFTPDGKQIVVGSQAGIVVHDAADLSPVGTIKSDIEQIHDLQFSLDGKRLLIAGGTPGESGIAEILTWPAQERVQRITAHDDLIYRVAWSPSGSEFATASADGICRVFDAGTGQERIRYAGHSRAVLAIAFLPDGNSLISAGIDQTLQLWDSRTGERLRALDNHLGPINDLAVRPTTKRDAPPVVVSASEDRTVRLWQPTIGRLMRFAKIASPPRCVAWSADGGQIVVGCNDGRIRRINPDTVEVERDDPVISGRIHVLIAGPQGQWFGGGEQAALRRVK